MSAKIEKRRMARAYGCQVERVDGRVRFSVHGDNAKGRMVEFVIDTDFRQWPCVARGFAKAWSAEKESRLNTIARIDATLPKEEAQ